MEKFSEVPHPTVSKPSSVPPRQQHKLQKYFQSSVVCKQQIGLLILPQKMEIY